MIGYDSDNLDDIPSTAELVLYYDDGESGSATPLQLSRFPWSYKQSITRNLTASAYWGDVEDGCLTIPEGVQAWRSGLVKGLYIDQADWPAMRTAITTARLPQPPYWVASYPLVLPTDPSVPQSWIDDGCVMWQYAGGGTSPGHYDLSVTAPGFPYIPPPTPTSEEDMIYGTDTQGRPIIVYPASGSNKPTILTQTGPPSPTNPFGIWQWGDMTNPIVTVNGSPPPVSV